MTPEELRQKAEEIYLATMCGGAGCCGDFEGAVDFIMAQVEDIESAAYTRGVKNKMMNHWCASS